MTTNVKNNLNQDERTPCEIWCRVMGYHRPINNWNVGKQQEHKDRLYFKESFYDYSVKKL